MTEDYGLDDPQIVQYDSFFGQKLSVFGLNVQKLFTGKQTELDRVIELMQQSDKPRAMYIY